MRVQMTGIHTKKANRVLVWEPKSNESVAKGYSIQAGERAILYTSDIGNLKTSWRVRVSQSQKSEA